VSYDIYDNQNIYNNYREAIVKAIENCKRLLSYSYDML